MSSTNTQTLKEQFGNAKETHKENYSKEELISYHEIEKTPFTIVNDKENKRFFGVVAEHRITEFYDTFEECEKDVLEMTWDRITQVILILVEKQNRVLEFINNQKEQ